MLLPEEQRCIYNDIIRRLTFTPCISQRLFVDTIIEYNLGIDEYNALIIKMETDKNGSFLYEYSNHSSVASKKCKRLLEHLVLTDNPSIPLSELIKESKWFDNTMKKYLIQIYNEMNNILNHSTIHGIKFPIIKNPISKDIALSGLSDDELENVKPFIQKYYPYISLNERNGFNYIEFVLIINICKIKQSRALTQLNKILSHTTPKKNAEKWVNDVILNMRSENMQRLYFDMFFHVIYNDLVESHNKLLIDYGKILWLPEKYKKRKDILNAIEKYSVRQNDIQFSTPYEEFTLYEKESYALELHNMLSSIIPLTWSKLIYNYRTKKELLNPNLANNSHACTSIDTTNCEYIVKSYISQSIDAAAKILYKCLIDSYPKNP